MLVSLPHIFRHRSSSNLEHRLQPPEPTFAVSVDGQVVCLFGKWPGIIFTITHLVSSLGKEGIH